MSNWLDWWKAHKREIERQAGIQNAAGRRPDVAPWDVWCQRFGIDPNTPDERILDDYLHGRTPRVIDYGLVNLEAQIPESFGVDWGSGDDYTVIYDRASGLRVRLPKRWGPEPLQWRDEAQREFYQGWDAYDAVPRGPLSLRAQVKAETYELERWWTL